MKLILIKFLFLKLKFENFSDSELREKLSRIFGTILLMSCQVENNILEKLFFPQNSTNLQEQLLKTMTG